MLWRKIYKSNFAFHIFYTFYYRTRFNFTIILLVFFLYFIFFPLFLYHNFGYSCIIDVMREKVMRITTWRFVFITTFLSFCSSWFSRFLFLVELSVENPLFFFARWSSIFDICFDISFNVLQMSFMTLNILSPISILVENCYYYRRGGGWCRRVAGGHVASCTHTHTHRAVYSVIYLSTVRWQWDVISNGVMRCTTSSTFLSFYKKNSSKCLISPDIWINQ